MSNNIEEGCGLTSKKEFNNFLNISQRSTFENADVHFVLNMRNLITEEKLNNLLDKLDKEY